MNERERLLGGKQLDKLTSKQWNLGKYREVSKVHQELISARTEI